jgi:hypothetical protein
MSKDFLIPIGFFIVVVGISFAVQYLEEPTQIRIHIDSSFCDQGVK